MFEQNFLHQLKAVLKQNREFIAEDGEILQTKVYASAMAMDKKLLKLLLENESTRNHFFTEVEDNFVFDKSKFVWVLESRELLEDSYTSYKNKIGLVDNDERLISQTDEISLVWPYKDCVLAGGQTKEEQNRNEIFYNETLAPEQVNQLLHPKVFTNAKKYSANNEINIDSLEDNENYIIKGNNLLVLSSIANVYNGKINTIYIDPPFNTGNDSFNYNDRFSRSTWLTFMKNRLELAKDLLTHDGNIFIHIDHNQGHYLKVLLDEIFGEENFVQEIIWAYGSASGGRAAGTKPVNIHDYILHYAKSYSNRKENKLFTPYSQKYIDEWFKYDDGDGRIYRRRHRGKDENGNAIWEKQYLDESKGVPLTTVWNDINQVYANPQAFKQENRATSEIELDFGNSGQKPEKLIQRIIEMSTNEGDVVLDFFMGSGTTPATAMKMNRRFIGIEQMDSQIDISVNRLIDVINGKQSGISKDVDWQGGGSFVYCELKKLNEKYIESIELASSHELLEEIRKSLFETGFISYKVNVEQINEEIDEYNDLSLEEKKKLLIELVDKNKLYVNYSDIDDEEMKVSEQEKKFTHSFYSRGEN